MNDELSFAKVTAPYSTGTVRRRRLFARLDAAPPAIFISAPPGAGKTTLANSYLADAGRPPLWYDIDPSDADPASFFFHLRAAVPSPPEDLPLLTAERMGGPESFAREFFRRLFALNAPFDLVLDNCHELPEDAELFRLLRYAFPELHASRRLFLLSRNAIPGPLARYQLDGSLERLDGDDLRLDNDEVIAITRLVSSPSKKPEETDRLAERSGGWAAGLMLLLSREASAMEGADRRNELLFDYFTSEVFQGLAGAEQRFLLRAAYLPWFTPETAKRLTNEPASEAIIHTLARRNAFLEKRTAANQTVYRFHPLFREYLQHQARLRIPPAERAALANAAADILEEGGHPEEAARHYLDSGDGDALAGLITRHAADLLRTGRHRTLGTWLAGLPESRREREPELALWQAGALLPLSPAEAYRWYRLALDGFREQGSNDGIVRSLAGAMDAVFYGGSDFTALDPIIQSLEWAEPLITARDDPVGQEALASVFLAVVVRQPDHPRFGVWLEHTEKAFRRTADPGTRRLLAHHLGTYHYWRGDFVHMGVMADQLRQDPDTGQPVLTRIMAKMLDAFHAWLTHHPTHCLQVVGAYREIVEETGIHLWDAHMASAAAAALIGEGRLDEAEQWLEPAGAPHHGRLFDSALYYLMAAWLRFRRGDTAGAHEYAVRQLAVAEQLGAMLPLAGGHFIVAQTAQALGGREKAAHHVSRSLHYGERMDSDFIRFMGRLAEAQYALEAEERETARRQLGEAFALGRRHGYTNWLLFHPSSAHRLCRFALDEDIEPEYAAWLMEQRDLETEPGSCAPLRVHCLGRFQVFRNNRPLFTGKRVPKRPLALLKALLSAGGRPVSKAVLLDRLWPDADGDAASSALSTNLRRLRRLLGTADAVRLERGQLSIDPQRCIVDAFHFGERLSAPPEPLSDQQLHETVALYQGPYLEGELDDPATNAERQRLRRLYASGVNELATRLSNHGDEDAAMTLWESALATDPTAGPLCHALMAWHADRGRHAEARAVYLRCRDLLYAAGEAPSEPLVTLYRKIPSEPLL